MAMCSYCGHRKGKRSCPALAGTICSACCGQHRLRDINCPDDCVHLGGLAIARGTTVTGFTKAELDAAWDKLHAYAEKARDFRNEALPRVFEDSQPVRWELDLGAAYLYYGHRDAGGNRLVDLFIAACGRDLARGEIAAAVALRDAWASLFEIVSVGPGVGLELRDLRSGELHRVREALATTQLQPGSVIFAWVMTLPDHLALTRAVAVPQEHRERVRSAIDAEVATSRARWPATTERELVGSVAWVVADVLRTVARERARDPEVSAAATPGGAPEVGPTETTPHDPVTARGAQRGEPLRSESASFSDESGDTGNQRAHEGRSESAGSTAPPASTAPSTVIPPLAHEVMYRLVVGFEEAIEIAARQVRRGGWQETDILDPKALLDRSQIDGYLFPMGRAMMAAGWDERSALQELELLSVHAFNVLSYQLHRRKTFWVDESLAFMLGCTRLDVRGEGFRLPFPSFALVFTDRATLALAEALAGRADVSTVKGRTLRALTTYVTQVPAERGVLGLHVNLMLDGGSDEWPWIVTRDLDITPDNTVDEILESRFPDVKNTDPIFASAELRQLLSLIVNAILFATSSPSWPVIEPPRRPSHAKPDQPPRRPRHTHEPPPDRTGEQVWHLPGKIPISQVRALRELQTSSQHGALFSRSMVRGHWRRAPDTWRDRSPRWIEPYWKGPELADIVEREYRLKP